MCLNVSRLAADLSFSLCFEIGHRQDNGLTQFVALGLCLLSSKQVLGLMQVYDLLPCTDLCVSSGLRLVQVRLGQVKLGFCRL